MSMNRVEGCICQVTDNGDGTYTRTMDPNCKAVHSKLEWGVTPEGKKRCIGFGEHEGKCENAVNPARNPIWCSVCDDLRMEHLDKQFKELGGKLTDIVLSPEARQAVTITASEAIFGFVSWLTTRRKAVTIGAEHECGTVAELAGLWCKVNGLPEPRSGFYPANIQHPVEESSEGGIDEA